MESAPSPLSFRHIVHTTVEEVKPDPDGGWWVHFLGSRESLHFPDPYSVGDQVKITFEKVTNA